ncbi:MAG: peptidoglycan-binding protein, partial [Clostridia bacterium]|nr:peptidoglycan-binding protein [Clostridia bacterium]
QPGDVVFFYSTSKGRIGHVGIVYKVTSSRVYTIEGNTSGGSSLITNGGSVAMKSYSLTSTYIDGYGRPDYAGVEAGTGEAVSFELGERLLVNGCKGDDVQEMQEALISLGFSCGSYGADGNFGDATELAVIAFQRKHGLDDDGEYGPLTHAAMTKALEALNKPVGQPKTVIISGGDCWIRTAPDTGAEKLGVAKEGETYKYQGVTSENGWPLIEFNNQNAWVSSKYGVVKAG